VQQTGPQEDEAVTINDKVRAEGVSLNGETPLTPSGPGRYRSASQVSV